MRKSQRTEMTGPKPRKDLLIATLIAISGGVLVGLTAELSHEQYFPFLAPHRDRIIAAEIALFVVLVVEVAGRAILDYFRQRDALQLGIAIRTAVRTISYLMLSIAVISLLSSNPALAVGIGSATGLIIGLAFQNTIGNIFAGMILAFGNYFKVGDEISIMGNTGRVMEIGLMYTLIDSGDQWTLVPSTVLLTNALQRKKRRIEQTADQKDSLKQGSSGDESPGSVADLDQDIARQKKKGPS